MQEGVQYAWWDCDGDFNEDHYCEGGGYCGCIQSSMNCADTWPMVCAYGHDFSATTKPPEIQLPAENQDAGAVTLHNAAQGSGFELVEWRTKLNASVHRGQTVAIVQPWLSDGDYIATEEVKTERDGYVVSMQDIEPGAVVGGGEQLLFVSGKPLPAVVTPKPFSVHMPDMPKSNLPWKTIAAVLGGLCLLCCLIALLAYLIPLCCKKREEEERQPAVVFDEPPKMEEQPLLVEEPINPIMSNQPRGVPIYFDDIPYYCEYKPLQIKYHQKHPIKVDNFFFNSYGQFLGIQKGQRITKVVDEDVSEEHHFKVVEDKIARALDPLPWWPLVVEFRTPEGELRTFDFVHRPLGIKFTRHLPIKVEQFKANSYAQDMGVQTGWEITKIGPDDVTQDHSFSHVDHNLLEGLKYLPERPHK